MYNRNIASIQLKIHMLTNSKESWTQNGPNEKIWTFIVGNSFWKSLAIVGLYNKYRSVSVSSIHPRGGLLYGSTFYLLNMLDATNFTVFISNYLYSGWYKIYNQSLSFDWWGGYFGHASLCGLIPRSMTEYTLIHQVLNMGGWSFWNPFHWVLWLLFIQAWETVGEENESKSRSASLKANLCDGCFTGEATDGITDAS